MNKFAYSPEHQTQQSGIYHQGLIQSTHKTQVDREGQLNHMFSQFQQDFTYEELMQFLDHWNKVPYDRNIALQLFQECHQENQRIQARDFINQFIDTERNLNFRISYVESEKEELIKQKNELIKKLSSIRPNNVDKVILKIQSAKNLEPVDRFSQIDAFVQIYIDGQHFSSTQVLPNNQNPVWNEVFTLEIQPSTSQYQQREIVLIVNDRKRLVVQDEIGRIAINHKDLEKNMLIQKEDYLKHGEYRTQATLAYEAKFVLSEAKLVQNDIRLKEEEIKQKAEGMRPTQIILAKLTELFSENKNTYQNIEISNNYQGANAGGYGVGSGHYEINKSVNMMNLSAYYFPTIKEQKFEQKMLEKLDQYTNEFIDDWTKTTIMFLISTTSLCLVQCIYKPQFLELTLLLIYLGLFFSGILTHTQHRFVSIILIFSWFYDIIWLMFLSKKWYGFENYSNVDSGMRSFVIIISIISCIFSKFPLCICMWRAYFKFDRYRDQIIKIKNKMLSLNSLVMSNSDNQAQAYNMQQQQMSGHTQYGGYTTNQKTNVQLTPNPSQQRQEQQQYGLQNPYETQYHQQVGAYQVSTPQQHFQNQQVQQIQQQQLYQPATTNYFTLQGQYQQNQQQAYASNQHNDYIY